MLVLSRKPQERIRIGADIVVAVLRIGRASVRIGIDAPGLSIVREDVEIRFTIPDAGEESQVNLEADHI